MDNNFDDEIDFSELDLDEIKDKVGVDGFEYFDSDDDEPKELEF